MELQQELLWKIVERELGTGLISCEPLNAGGSADVYRATVKGEPHTACIKLFRSEGAAGMARQEAEQIALLAQYSIIPFPRLYFVHDATPEEPLEALGMELMPGVSALNKTFYWSERNIFQDCQVIKKVKLLKHHAHLLADFIKLHLRISDELIFKPDFPFRRLF